MNKRSKPTTGAGFIVVLLALLWCAGCGDRAAPGRPDGGESDAGEVDAGPAEDMDAGLSTIGEPCAGPTDCRAGAACIGRAGGGFVCMANCDTTYALCADGSVCTPVSNGASNVCYIGGSLRREEPCSSNLECGSGLLCFGSDSSYFCKDACDPAAPQCLPGEFCLPLNTGAGICRDIVGAGCEQASDCPVDGLTCASGLDTTWGAQFPGGYCTTTCATDDECSFGSRCASLDGSSSSVCVKGCEHVSDCRFNEAYRCVSRAECDDEADTERCQALTLAGSACLR